MGMDPASAARTKCQLLAMGVMDLVPANGVRSGGCVPKACSVLPKQVGTQCQQLGQGGGLGHYVSKNNQLQR